MDKSEFVVPTDKIRLLPPTPEINSRARLLKRVRKIGAVACIGLMSAIPLGSKLIEGDSLLVPKMAYGCLTDQTCQAVPESDLSIAQHAVDSPVSPEELKLEQALENEPKYIFEENEFKYFEKQANKYGFTLVDSVPYEKEIDSADNLDEATSILNSFTKNFGFDVTIPDKMGVEDWVTGAKAIDKNQMSLSEFKLGTESLMAVFSTIPKEVVRYADVSTIKIVDSLGEVNSDLEKSKGLTVGGEANTINGIIYITYKDMVVGDFSLFIHEFSHRLDYQMSGGFWNASHDPGFTGLNEKGFEYSNLELATKYHDTVELYGATNVLEDKATLYEDILCGLGDNAFHNNSPVVRDKATYLLGRLEQHFPGIAYYLKDITSQKQN
jgi:hypothetical protein